MTHKVHAVKKTLTPPVRSNGKTLQKAPAAKMFPITEAVKIDLRAQPDNVVKKEVKPPLKVNPQKLQEVSTHTGFRMKLLDLLSESEGIRQEPYTIAGGHTIGFGHLMDDDPRCKSLLEAFKEAEKATKKGEKPNKEELVMDEDKIYSLLEEDLLKKKADAKKMLPNFDSLKPGQKEAVVDLFFNLRPEALKKSKFIKAVRSNNFDEAIREMAFGWAGKGKNKTMYQGLWIRRIKEAGLLAEGEQPDKAKLAINDMIKRAGGGTRVTVAGQKVMEELEIDWAMQHPHNNNVVASNN